MRINLNRRLPNSFYLAQPYSDPDASVRSRRYIQGMEAVAQLMEHGYTPYAPIVHNHMLAVAHELPGTWEFWRIHDLRMIAKMGTVVVLEIEGWDQSTGVAEEVLFALNNSIPVYYLPTTA